MIGSYVIPSRHSASDYTRKARALFRLAGGSDEPETRALILNGATIQLAAARAARAGAA